MSRRGILKGVACGLLGTFVSRNNDVDGYWGLGVLRLFAERNNLSQLTIDVLHKSPNLSFESPMRISEETYRQWFRNALFKAKIYPSDIKEANIYLRFTTFDEFPKTIRDTRGEPYLCTVSISNNSRIISVSRIGVCAAHDPRKDRRRAC